MNKFTRLTALLLALMMILSTFASAETAYQVGDMSTSDWQTIVDTAEEKLFTTEPGGAPLPTPTPTPTPEQKDYYPYNDCTPLAVGDAAVSGTITSSGVAVLTNASAGQWQMLIGDTWVNISGETGESLWVTAAMMNGLTTADFHKALEPVDAETGEYTTFTQTATVSIVEAAATLSTQTRADSTTDEGTTEESATATATPPAAAGDVMTLEEANNKIGLEIRYMRKGVAVASTYSASFVKGASYSATVTHPSVVGYVPTYQEATSTIPGVTVTTTTSTAGVETSLTYSFTNLQADSDTLTNIIIYVEYQPTTVTYTVNHWQQNVDDDGYTLVATEPKTGMTEATAVATANTYAGFYSLLFETPTIAADGSTVVDIYYDRYYYLMNFDLGGGYGVEPVYGRYGMDIGEIGTPTRAGYTFARWSATPDGEATTIPTTMPDEHVTYYAVWTTGASQYTVVYWRADLDDDDDTTPKTYSYWGQKTVMADSGVVLVPSDVGNDHPATTAGFNNDEARYFTYNADVTAAQNAQTVTVAGDGSTVINVYYDRKVYEIRYLYAYEGDLTNNNNNDNYYIYTLTGNGKVGVTISYQQNNQTTTGVRNLPTVTGYTSATEKVGNFTYYYISIKAEYGASIDTIWPAAAIGSTGNYYWGSWAAEDGTGYRNTYGDAHANIVGTYPVMSAEMIKDPNAADGVAQRMLAWWGNSNQNIELHTYHIYFEVLPGETADKEYNGKQYVLVDSVDFTCAHNGSTRVDPFEYAGFTCVNDTRKSANDYQEDSNNYENTTTNKDAGRYDCPYTEDQCQYCNVFYYERNTYTLSFFNYNAESVAPDSKTLMFGESFSTYKPDDPAYPTNVEPGAYEFVGWYTTPECYAGTEVDWNSTMPAGDVTLYAKWAPITHTVRFFLTEELMETGLNENVYIPQVIYNEEDGTISAGVVGAAYFSGVPHGTVISQQYVNWCLDYDAMIAANPNDPYNFVAWFYYDENGEKTAFDPTMQIRQNLDLFAEWTSDVMVPYRVRYVYVDANNTEIQIADDLTGSGLAGNSKTFDAKIGAELYEGYQSGYYPSVTRSHNVPLEIKDEDGVEGADEVVYTFYYYQRDAVPYLVYYLTDELKENGTPLGSVVLDGVTYYIIAEQKVVADNHDSIVSEEFVVISGYMPDAYQKNLVLNGAESDAWITVDGTDIKVHPENVIIFYYSVNTTDAFYKMSHHFMNLDGTTYTETASEQFIGNIDTTYQHDPMETIPEGFSYQYTKVVTADGTEVSDNVEDPTRAVTAELTAEGLEFKHYYMRNPYPYTVHYYLNGTTTKLHADKVVEGTLYGTYVTETYVNLSPAYRLVGAETQSITIGVDDGEGEPENVIIFYYAEQPITIAYEAVGGGTVSPSSETLDAVTGTATGSVAKPDENYKFVGWYVDKACETPVAEADGTVTEVTDGTKFVPAQEAASDVLPAHYVEATFYALFELDVADLTITKTVFDATYTAAPTTDRFTIQVTFSGASVAASYNYTITNNGNVVKDDTVTVTGNVAVFTDIKHGDVIVIKDVVIGTGYTVKETDMEHYTETVNAYGQTAIQAPDEEGTNNTVSVTNQYLTGSLTITKTLSANSTPDNESFIFRVTSPDGYEAYVTISGAGSVTLTNLKLGTYTVEETSWSFRYTPGSTEATVELTQTSLTGEVSFTNSEKPEKWLHDEYSVHNDFSNPGTYGDTSSTN